jgi:hypothetical protein
LSILAGMLADHALDEDHSWVIVHHSFHLHKQGRFIVAMLMFHGAANICLPRRGRSAADQQTRSNGT